MIEKRPRVEPQDVLTAADLQLLSPEAARTYASIWHSLDNRHSLRTYLKDEVLSWTARVVLPKVDAARRELVKAGLLTMHLGAEIDGMVSGATYSLPVEG